MRSIYNSIMLDTTQIAFEGEETCDLTASEIPEFACHHCKDEGVTYSGSYEHGPFAHELPCNYCDAVRQ